MNAQLVEQALEIIPNKPFLINMVSKRVRQLMAGSRPLIEDTFRIGLADIALTEIANNKVTAIQDDSSEEEDEVAY